MMEIGAQLYTIRNYCQNEKTLARSLEKVAQIGYKTVQVSGVGPIAPKTIRKLCDDNGLKIVLTHNPEKRFLFELDSLIEEHQIYGCKYIGLGAMSDCYRNGDWAEAFAGDYIPVCEKLKANGMRFMYHNHAFEFEKLKDGSTLMDRILSLVPADLMGVTADTYWLQFGGMDVADWLAHHGDRLECVHFKDFTPFGFTTRMAAVGRGNINYEKILNILRANGHTEYVLVEQDDCYGEYPFDCLKQSYDELKRLGC